MEQKKSVQHPALTDSKLSWVPSQGLRVPPLYIKPENNSQRETISQGNYENRWKFMQSYRVGENRELLIALENGLEAIEISLNSHDKFNPQEILDQVLPGMIEIHFNFSDESGGYSDCISKFIKWLEHTETNLTECSGSFRMPENSDAFMLFNEFGPVLPGFKWFYFTSGKTPGVDDKIGQLEWLFTSYLKYMEDFNGGMKDFLRNSCFRLFTGRDFISEVAKIRAFFLIWDLITNHLGMGSVEADLEISADPGSFEENTFNNLIRSTSIFTSAVIGGAGRVHLPDSPGSFTGNLNDPQSFIRRMNLNISHILKNEAHFTKVVDPASGSYAVEALSEKFASIAWERIRGRL